MSKSNIKGQSFVSKISAKIKDQHSDESGARPSSRGRSYLPQVQEKIDKLERKERRLLQSSISTHEPSEQSHSLQNASLSQNELSSLSAEHSIVEITDGSCNRCRQSLKIAPVLQSLRSMHEQSTVADQGEEREINLAEHLTNPEEIMSCYFSQTIREHAILTSDSGGDTMKPDLVTSSQEPLLAVDTGAHQANKICNVPLKLTLIPVSHGKTTASRFFSTLEAEYGPLHATLLVGNVLLEWDDASLVVPRIVESNIGGLQSHTPQRNDWVEISAGRNVGMRLAAERRDFHEDIELVYFIDSVAVQVINALVDVIVKYNSIYYHHVMYRNCRHFVIDALKALGVERPITLTQGLHEYYKTLKVGRSKSTPDKFQSHSELDTHVKRILQNGEIDSVPRQDLEFLLVQYFLFHLQCKCALKDDPIAVDGWKCSEVECHMKELEKNVQFESLRIHNFRTQ